MAETASFQPLALVDGHAEGVSKRADSAGSMRALLVAEAELGERIMRALIRAGQPIRAVSVVRC